MKARISLFAAFLAASLLSCSSQRPSPAVAWTLVGPFDNPATPDSSCPAFFKDCLAAYGGEAAASLPGSTALDAARSAAAREAGGVLDFLSALGGGEWAVAYAYRDFDSSGGEAVLRVGSDDGIRLWLNGELVVDRHVHRALDPGSEALRVSFVPGKNRLLAKVDQGIGAWSLSLRVEPVADEEARLAALIASGAKLGLSVSVSGDALGGAVSFTAACVPPLALDLPLDYSVSSRDGRVLASGSCRLGRAQAARLPASATGVLSLSVALARTAPERLASAFAGGPARAVILNGDREALMGEIARRARAAAARLGAADSLDDTAATLEFLADRLEGRLDPSLETEELRARAAGFAQDVMDALRDTASGAPAAGIAALRGYRQMAYRSAIDGCLQPYSLYLPSGFDPSRRYGLVVALHGYTGEDYGGGAHLAALAPADLIVLSAYGRGDMHYRSVGEQDVLDIMDRILARYPIDPDRVYLTGISMGGLGTWRLGQLYPDRFAAIAPFCGWTGTEWLSNLRSLPALVVHGDSDRTVPAGMDRAAVARMRKLGFDVRYDELPGVDHDAWSGWTRSRSGEALFEFFRAHRRPASPERVTASIPYARYGRQYWLRIDGLDTGGALSRPTRAALGPSLPAPGSVDARRESPSRIRISTERVRALALDLAAAGVGQAGAATIAIDGSLVAVAAGTKSITLARARGGAWGLAAGAAALGEATPGEATQGEATQGEATPGAPEAPAVLPRHEGGGLADLFTKPLVIAYGTLDGSRRPVLEAAARALADWSWTPSIPIGVKTGRFEVKPDFGVTEGDLRSKEIIVLGGERENSLAARSAEALRPYYEGGAAFLGGKAFPGAGLAIVLPSPLAAGRLVGYVDIPEEMLPDSASASAWFKSFPFRVRAADVDESATYPGFCPDAMALTRDPFKDAWSGWFDRGWSSLEGR